MIPADISLITNGENIEVPEGFISEAKKFRRALLIYDCALREITTKLSVLDAELAHLSSRNPISAIKSRVKSPQSIATKLLREKLPLTVESMKHHLNDIAGVRVICSYIDDIYEVAEMLMKQDDLHIIAVKDYIKEPKDNGYRSYHMIVDIPVFLSSGKHFTRVEIQLRTIAMDFWASLEHEIRYKREHQHLSQVADALKICADTIAYTDEKMLNIRRLIEDE